MGNRRTGMRIAAIIGLLYFHLSTIAYAEVLDKFGGCTYPPDLTEVAIITVIGIVVFALKRSLYKYYLIIAGLILFSILSQYLLHSSGFGDSAIMYRYLESNDTCPQFHILNWGQQILLSIISSSLILGFLFWKARKT